MSEHDFCRTFLTQVMGDVRKLTTAEERKKSWAYRDSMGNVEFHGPGGFYWHGRGCCKWYAQAEGWIAWLEKQKGAEDGGDSREDG